MRRAAPARTVAVTLIIGLLSSVSAFTGGAAARTTAPTPPDPTMTDGVASTADAPPGRDDGSVRGDGPAQDDASAQDDAAPGCPNRTLPP
ncbi:hypothetical protein, partial [Saccharomonospora iraqiensis]|uniref:hypothetical protein n=1 Tax=Saccharomonospora iraqiensis TaxID=52698 RepID=UPI00022E03FA